LARFALLAFVAVFGCRSASPPEPKWNVLVIVPDTIRGDHLSINGYFRKTTPHLDRFAAEGTNFSQAITAAAQTWQSYTSIMTGLYPPHHGVRFHFDFSLDAKFPTLATELKKAGYDTKCFDRLPFMRRMLGERGFDGFDDVIASTDETVLQSVWSFVSAPRKNPFFAFVRINGAHWPYDETPDGFESCEGQDHSFNVSTERLMGLGPGIRGKGMTLAKKDAYRKIVFDTNIDERTLKHRIAHYDAGVRRTDEDINWLLDQMRSAGLLKNTIVLITSDHGESFGEHGYWQHGPRADEPISRVPLILYLPPGHPSHSPGKKIDGLVRTVDIMPTLLASVGEPIPGDLDGINLLPYLGAEPLPELWAYTESGKDFVGVDPELFIDGPAGKHRAVREARWKLIYIPKPGGGEFRLFDLQADPGETRNLAHEHPEEVKRLFAHLKTILDSDEDEGTRERRLTDAEKEQLRQLGYLE
jgi:arylsulfatase A-like enzyme